jgi:hypothetical protein
MLTPTPVAPEQLQALRILTECAYQPSDARLHAVLGHDWSLFPRVASVLAALPSPVTRDALCEAVLALLREAVQDLEPCFPPRKGAINALEVFRAHVLEQVSWSALEQQLLEEGRSHARGTLIRRQHEFLPYLAEWARQVECAPELQESERGSSVDERLVPSERGATVEGNGSAARSKNAGAWWMPAFAVLLLLGAVLVTLWWPRDRTVEREAVSTREEVAASLTGLDPLRTGRGFGWTFGDATLPMPYPPIAVPEPRGRRNYGMVVEYAPQKWGLLLPERNHGEGPARMTMFDPVEERVVWEYSYEPPREERLTHATVGPEVLDEPYDVIRLYHSGPEGTLGDHVVVVNRQIYSPTFVTYVHRETGAVEGYYVHPGYLEVGIVYDVDGDGRLEAVLGGTDNAVDRPVVLALRPTPGRSAASTVQWNENGREGAVVRLLLPAAAEACGPAGTARLTVFEIEERYFDRRNRLLTVGVSYRGRPHRTVYHARVGAHLTPDPVAPLVLWDEDVLELEALGVDPMLRETWAADFVHRAGDRDEP